jgi:hypothetical protein
MLAMMSGDNVTEGLTSTPRNGWTAHVSKRQQPYDPPKQWARPSLEADRLPVDGPGMKTIIPVQSGFKVTMPLVADQDPHEIA